MLQNPKIIIVLLFFGMNAVSHKVQVNHNQCIHEEGIVSGNSKESKDEKNYDDDRR